MRFSKIENPTVRFGAIFKNRKCYGAVRCGFQKSKILRSGSVRFSKIVNATVRFGAFMYPTVRFGTVFRNLTVRFGAVFRYCKSYFAVRCSDVSCGAVRYGFENRKYYGAVRWGFQIL